MACLARDHEVVLTPGCDRSGNVRIATLVIGAPLTGSLFVRSLSSFGHSSAASPLPTAAAMGIGLVMALLWLAASGIVAWSPGVATGLYLPAAGLGLIGATATPTRELAVWAGLSVVLSVTSYLGYRSERSRRHAERVEATEAARAAWDQHQQGLAAPATPVSVGEPAIGSEP